MNALSHPPHHARQMNEALVSRGLLPMDGYCNCLECGRSGLDRDDMADPGTLPHHVCRNCLDVLLSGYRDCSECHCGSRGTTSYDYVRGKFHTDWCARCNGNGRVFVGVPERLKHLRRIEDVQTRGLGE